MVSGDTLWDLAAEFYGDPYLWPQLWEQNQYVLDSHWIYPGDPLIVGLEVETIDDLADLEGDGAAEGDETMLTSTGASPPVPLGSESDIYCTGYVGELEEGFGYSIIGSEHEALTVTISGTERANVTGEYGTVDTVKYSLANGDIVYTDGGRLGGLTAGSQFTIIQPGRLVEHPVSGQTFGRHYQYTGRLRILSVQEETAIAEIVHSCAPVVVGSVLKPFEPEPIPLKRQTPPRPLNYPASREQLEAAPVILTAHDEVISLGESHVVFIDQGEAEDVVPGDIYTIYRLHRRGLPPVVLGEVAVLSVHPRSSVARIIRSRYAIYVGDLLELK